MMALEQVREHWRGQLQTSFLTHRNEPRLSMYADADYAEMAGKIERAAYLLNRSVEYNYVVKIEEIIGSINHSAELLVLLLKGRKRADEVVGTENIQIFLQSIESNKIPCESCQEVQAVKIGGLYSGTGESTRFRYQCWSCEYEWTGSPKFGV